MGCRRCGAVLLERCACAEGEATLRPAWLPILLQLVLRHTSHLAVEGQAVGNFRCLREVVEHNHVCFAPLKVVHLCMYLLFEPRSRQAKCNAKLQFGKSRKGVKPRSLVMWTARRPLLATG